MLIIDRFEGDWVVVEFKNQTFKLPKAVLPVGTKEGDVLDITIKVDKAETEKRKNILKGLTDELF